MKFNKWFKQTFDSKFGSCLQDEATFLGWSACKKETLELLKRLDEEKGGLDIRYVIKQIEEKI